MAFSGKKEQYNIGAAISRETTAAVHDFIPSKKILLLGIDMLSIVSLKFHMSKSLKTAATCIHKRNEGILLTLTNQSRNSQCTYIIRQNTPSKIFNS